MFEQEKWQRSTQTESREPKNSKPESHSAGSDEELQEYHCLTFDPFSTRDAMAEEVEHNIDSPTEADDDVTLDKENKIDHDQESEEIVDKTVNAPTPKRRTRSQRKKPFIIPEAASPSDSEDEPTTSKRRISRTKARSKYLRSIQASGSSPQKDILRYPSNKSKD